jgi:predicted Rossmann-fold nucleotide-binding protein
MAPVRRQRGRTVEIDSLAELEAMLGRGATSMSGWHVQGLDLHHYTDRLRGLDAEGALFLGCRFGSDGDGRAVEEELRERGALIFPVVPDVPVDAYRTGLYSPAELYDGLERSYEATADARIYAWSNGDGVDRSLAKALHDHAVDDALRDHVAGRRLVGVMGGHALRRDTEEYAAAARLGHALARGGLTVCTGGGPGAMEAANLGAYLSTHPLHVLDEALALLAAAPGFRPSVTAWARAAIGVLQRWPDGADSVGIPTWHYGHEPPNLFATAIAKYFKNAIREDILLHVCQAGIVFLPGAGGTVQEIFQDACENYYADPARLAPMVLVGEQHWTVTLPAWPLLRALADDRPMQPVVHLVDDPRDVPALVLDRPC